MGSMGHANQIALGIALSKPDRTVICFDGDGAVLMHAGSMGIIGDLSPRNLKHIIFNNPTYTPVILNIDDDVIYIICGPEIFILVR